MKYILILTLCSLVDKTCTDPHVFHTDFNNLYECQLNGYAQSMHKVQKIGSDTINKHGIYVKFACSEVETI
jgi:predicted house-cleaning NTP pyrophosphatase (Maf/HAM1 superfamily)